jgi:hypothetical protein
MKKIIFLTTFAVSVSIIACNKSADNASNDCGCNTDSVKYTFINREGIFRFDSMRNGWGITIQFPTDDSYECKICNADFFDVTAITDTLSKNDSIPVIFTGKLKMLCPNEIDFNYFPEHQQYDVSIDSLQKN